MVPSMHCRKVTEQNCIFKIGSPVLWKAFTAARFQTKTLFSKRFMLEYIPMPHIKAKVNNTGGGGGEGGRGLR